MRWRQEQDGVPRTRSNLDRDTKIDQILAVAEQQLLEGGYGNLSLAAIARTLGIRQGSIYWYFPSKDHLLVAAIERTLVALAAHKPSGEGLVTEILWAVEQLEQFQSLRVAVHERARSAPVVADFERRFRALLETMLTGALRPHMSAADLDLAADAFLAIVEGVLLQRIEPSRRTRVLTFALERLIDARPLRDD